MIIANPFKADKQYVFHVWFWFQKWVDMGISVSPGFVGSELCYLLKKGMKAKLDDLE